MKTETIEISTADGVMSAYEVTPDGSAKRAGIVLFMDGLGIRDALRKMADRLGAAGYRVLMPDMFHRIGREVHFDPKVVFATPDGFGVVRKTIGTLTTDQSMADADAALSTLASRADVDATRLGAVGYCMGGRIAMLAASRFPDRVKAAASIHGGGLVTSAMDSPHLVLGASRARLYFGGAKDDPSFTTENAKTLTEALERAGTSYELEQYDARHGWAIDDTPVYDSAEAERHWRAILALFEAALSERGSRA